MLVSKKIDVYRRKAKVILQVANGPGGWVAAIWSYVPKSGRFELNVSLHSHGLTSLGSTSIAVADGPVEGADADLKPLVQSPRSIHWHPSGERIVIVEAGKVFIFSVAWVSKIRRSDAEIQVNRITMKRASEITCDHIVEEDAAEREDVGAVAGAEVIGVKLSLRQSSININATGMAVSCAAFQDLGSSGHITSSTPSSSTKETGAANAASAAHAAPNHSTHHGQHSQHSARILVGTDSGAVLSLSFGWDDEGDGDGLPVGSTKSSHLDQSLHTTSTLSVSNHPQYQDNNNSDVEDEGRRRAHSVTAAGRLLATVIQPALSSADENRDILRLWKGCKYVLQNSGSQDILPEVIDIGNISEVHYGDSPVPNGGGSRLPMVDVDLDNDVGGGTESVNSASHHMSAYSASAVRELHFNDRSRMMVCLYGDGSFTTALLVPCVITIPADPSKVPVKTQPVSSAVQKAAPVPGQVHTFQVLRSAKVHPVALVAYPFLTPSTSISSAGTSSARSNNTTANSTSVQAESSSVNAQQPPPTPCLYEMGSAGVYRSTDYVSAHDISTVLDLSPSLLHKVTRMRKLVNSKAEEEISRVVCMRVVDDGEMHTSVLQNSTAGTTVSGSFKIVVVMQTKHLPTFAPVDAAAAAGGSAASAGAGTSSGTETSLHDSLIGKRCESTSMAVFDVSLVHHPAHTTAASVTAAVTIATTAAAPDSAGVVAIDHGYELYCVCTQVVALKNGFQASVSPRAGADAAPAPTLEVLHLPQQSGAHVLMVEGSGAVVCRPLDNLRAVLFSVSTLSTVPAQHVHVVTATVAASRLLLSVWDSSETVGHALPTGAPKVSDSTRDLLKLSLYNPVGSVRTPGSKVVVLPLLVSPTARALSGQSGCMFVDLNEGTLHYVDVDASENSSGSANNSDTRGDPLEFKHVFSPEESLQEYHTSLSTQQLKLPKRLLGDVMHYKQACAGGNPFQPRRSYRFLQEGLLIASSKQCRTEEFNPISSANKRNKAKSDFGRSSLTSMTDRKISASGDSTSTAATAAVTSEYLAFVAGGCTVPYKQPSSKQPAGAPTQVAEPVRRQTPLLWVYNRSTHRWRSTYLIVGNAESRACLVKDIPAAQSPRTAEFAALSSSVNVRPLSLRSTKVQQDTVTSLASQSLDNRHTEPLRSKSDEPLSPPRKLLAARLDTAPTKPDTAATKAIDKGTKDAAPGNNFGAEYTFAEAFAPRRTAPDAALTSVLPLKSAPTAAPAFSLTAPADLQKGNKRRYSANDVVGSPVGSPDRSGLKLSPAKASPEKTSTKGAAATSDGQPTKAAAGFSMQSLFSGPRWGSACSNSSGGAAAPETVNLPPVYKRSTSVPITGRSHMSGGTHAVLSVAWYGTHTIVLLTLRRSTYCIELLSREASKTSMNTGKLQPAVHKIIMLPPGYSPNSLEAVVVLCPAAARGAQSVAAGCPPARSGSQRFTRGQLFTRQAGNGTIAEGNESGSDAESALSGSSSDESMGDEPRWGKSASVESPSKSTKSGGVSLISGNSGVQESKISGDRSSSSGNLEGCVVVVSDGTTLLSYHVQVEGQLSAEARSSTANVGKSTTPHGNKCTLSYPPSLVVQDYAIAALWDTTLSALAVREDFCQTYEQQNPNSGGISFPLRETKVFVQNSPLQEHQQEGFQHITTLVRGRGLSPQPVFPVVSLVVLDALGKVWYVDADLKECTLLAAGPVSRVTAVHAPSVFGDTAGPAGGVAGSPGAAYGGVGGGAVSAFANRDGGDTPMSVLTTRTSASQNPFTRAPMLGDCFIFHVDEDPAAEAQRKLLQIFQKTSLIQHLRPSGWRMVDRLALPDSALWVPVAWSVGHKRRQRSQDGTPVHAFADEDVLLPRKRRLLHTTVTVPLPTLPSYAQFLGVGAGGVMSGVSAGCVDVTAGSSALCHRTDRSVAVHRFQEPSLLHIPLLSALFCTCLDSKAGFVEVVWEKERSEETSSEEHNANMSYTFAQRVLSKIRTSNSCTALLIDHLEQQVKAWAESKGFTHKHDGYNQLTSFLFAHDPTLLCELISRLGRKLEPSVSRHLFPVHLATEDSVPPSDSPRGLLVSPAEPEEPIRHTASVIRLYESALSVRHLHHAARVLSLACEAVGGSEDHISTAASLVMALELLHLSARSISLRNVAECLEFCLRLEDMLLMHSRGIFGNPHSRESRDGTGHNYSTERSLDSSYINTVKNRAMLLISSRRDAGTVTRRRKSDAKVRDGEAFTPLSAASPALPYYLGMGVGWIINKAVQNLALPSAAPPAAPSGTKAAAKTSAPGAQAGGSPTSRARLLPKALTLEVTRSRGNSVDTYRNLAQCTPSEHLRQVLWQSGAASTVSNDGYTYRVIEAIESQYGALAISQMLSRTSNHTFTAVASTPVSTPVPAATSSPTEAPPPPPPSTPVTESPRGRKRGDSNTAAAAIVGGSHAEPCRHSLTMLLLVQVMKDLFKSSSHYCNVAALMASLLQSPTSVDMMRSHILCTVSKSLSLSENTVTGATPQEKVRRVLYVFRLNKSLVRGVDADALLKQRINAQYLRRIIEADVIHGAHGSVYSESPRGVPNSPGQSVSTYNGGGGGGGAGGGSTTGKGADLSHRSVEYFELTEELLVHPARVQHSHSGKVHSQAHNQTHGQSSTVVASDGTTSTTSATATSSATAASATASAATGAVVGTTKTDVPAKKSSADGENKEKHGLDRHLTLLELLKALAVGMLLVGDVASAGLLLTTLCPHLKRLDRVMYDALVTLPAPVSAVVTAAAGGDSSSEGMVWKINAEQLQTLVHALSN